LLTAFVIGCNLVPEPPANIIPFMDFSMNECANVRMNE
jgi:hypothetical protein